MEAPRDSTRMAILGFVVIFITMQIKCCMAASTNATSSSSTNKLYTKFIKTQCNTTTYPSVCNKALSSYASKVKTDPQSLCYAAMSVALDAARNASSTVKKLLSKKGMTSTEKSTVADCVEELGDSIDELQQCLEALGSIRNAKGDREAEFQMDSIKTWASAAITDEYTCTDELEEENVSASVKKKISKSVVNLARHTSNALSLINHLTY